MREPLALSGGVSLFERALYIIFSAREKGYHSMSRLMIGIIYKQAFEPARTEALKLEKWLKEKDNGSPQ